MVIDYTKDTVVGNKKNNIFATIFIGAGLIILKIARYRFGRRVLFIALFCAVFFPTQELIKKNDIYVVIEAIAAWVLAFIIGSVSAVVYAKPPSKMDKVNSDLASLE